MDKLNKRQTAFIHSMMENMTYQSVSYYAKKLNVSTKTLQTDLKKIRVFLTKFQINISAGTGKGILLDSSASSNVKFLNELNKYEYESEEETSLRRDDILKNMLLQTGERTSIYKLSEKYYVSKTSIVNDMKHIEQLLAKYNLTLEKTKDGTYIKGQEVDIRKAIVAFTLRENARNELFELFSKEDVAFVEKILKDVEQNHQDIGDVYYTNLLTHILICVKRVSEMNQLEEENESRMINTDTLNEYQNARMIADKINQHFQIHIGEAETYYIYQYLISSGIGRDQEQERKEEDLQLKFAKEITSYLSKRFNVDFTQENDLMEGLILHIRPMLNRLQYDIQISNPFTDEIINRYAEMMDYCTQILQQMSVKYHLKEISKDEIANIATYYETILEKITSHKKVLVVCQSGYGTSQLLAAKIKNEFAFLEIVDVVSSRKAEDMQLENIDFIISTVPINRTDVPLVIVSALLTEQDIKNIKNNFMKE